MSENNFHERIVDLHAELRSYGKDITDHLVGIYSNNPNQTNIDLTLNPLNAVSLLQNDVLELLKESKHQNESNSAEQLHECEEIVKQMTSISNTVEAIELAQKYFNSSDILKICIHLSALQTHLTSLPSPSTEIGAGPVVGLLKKEAKLLKYQFGARMRRLISSCFQISPGRIAVTKTLSGMIKGEEDIIETPIKLADMWHAVSVTHHTESLVIEIWRAVWTNILLPLWREKKISSPRMTVAENDQSTFTFESIAKISINNNITSAGAKMEEDVVLSTVKIPLPQLFDFLSQVISFLCAEVFTGDEEAISVFSMIVSTAPLSLHATLCETITSHLPKTEKEIPAHQKQLEKPCKDFEAKLKSLNLVLPITPSSSPTISSLVADLSSKYIAESRKEILARAREVVLADYHNTMLAAGDALEDDPSSAGDVGDLKAMLEQFGSFTMQALRFDPCQVSLASCRLLKLIHEVMKQACLSSSDLAELLYHCARDCLELFIAIVPVKFAHIVATVPRMGAVFFNDCAYIAHNCTLISHLYRQDLAHASPRLLDTIGFIDYISRFRLVGEEVLAGHLEEQRKTLESLVARIHLSPSGEASPQPQQQAGVGMLNDEEAASLIVRHMQKLTGQWQGVLQDSVFVRLQAYLTEAVLRACMMPLLDTDCITEGAGADISRIFKTIQRIRSSFADSSDDAIAKLVVSWKKFIALTDLLEQSLSDVAEWLPRRKFSSFTSSEMASLIKALFQESPRRQLLLTTINEMAA